MSFGGKLSFWVCGFDVGALEPHHLVFCEDVRREVRPFSFHDFRGDFEGSGDLCPQLVEGFHSFLDRWYLGG